MLRSMPTLLVAFWIVMSAPILPATAAELLSEGDYEIVADKSWATLTVASPLGRIGAQMPMKEGRIVISNEGQIALAAGILDAAGATSKNSFVQTQMRGPIGLDTEVHPTAEFNVTKALVSGATVALEGDLTMKGVTRPVQFAGEIKDAGDRRFVLLMEGEINRAEFGITAGRPVYSRKAEVKLRLVARK